MIPGLLHGRLLGGAPSSGIIASPAYQTTLAFAAGDTSAETTAFFAIHANGTWTAWGHNYADKSGTWYDPVTAAVGAGYEARIVLERRAVIEPGVTDTAGIVSNALANWVALSASRQLSLKVQRFTQGRSIADYTATLQIRPAGGGSALSVGNFRIRSQVQVDSSLPPSGGGPIGDGEIPR